MRNAAMFGGRPPDEIQVDFPAVMERLRRIRARIARQDSAEHFRAMGVDVFLGQGVFTGRNRVDVAGATLHFKKAVIATGARPEMPPIPGLAEAGYLTNETVFNLTQRPGRLIVIGGGPLGCELAQAFRRLGSEVTICHKTPLFLPQEERDAAQLLAESFGRDGIHLALNCEAKNVTLAGKERRVCLVSAGHEETIAVDEILTAIGRVPNVEGLNLEAAGVTYDPEKGISVNDYLQTRNPNVYAAGDVCLEHKFAHAAEASARIVVKNALFFGRKKQSALTIPWCTYTDPEIAHVGMYVKDARDRGIPAKTYTIPMHEVDRFITDGEEDGFVKVHVKEGTDTLIGATIVARHAGEMINEISLAIMAGIGLGTLSQVIHAYPTQAAAIKKAADAYMRSRLTPFLKKLSTQWLAWTR
jgi:pyruvate/2-oxoglutarate dehydrogenase complex dihydrolipoamide dehydrogenase (E3) component